MKGIYCLCVRAPECFSNSPCQLTEPNHFFVWEVCYVNLEKNIINIYKCTHNLNPEHCHWLDICLTSGCLDLLP